MRKQCSFSRFPGKNATVGTIVYESCTLIYYSLVTGPTTKVCRELLQERNANFAWESLLFQILIQMIWGCKNGLPGWIGWRFLGSLPTKVRRACRHGKCSLFTKLRLLPCGALFLNKKINWIRMQMIRHWNVVVECEYVYKVRTITIRVCG